MTTNYRFLEVHKAKAVCHVAFRSGPSNGITGEFLDEMSRLLSDLDHDDESHAVVLTSSVKGVFSRGLDLPALRSLDEVQLGELLACSRAVLERIADSPIPFICGVGGDCFGAGLELMLSCDIRIAAASAQFGAPEVIFGLVPTAGCIRRLFAGVGTGHTARLLLTGMKLGAAEARAIGLIEEVVSEEELSPRLTELAQRLGRIRRSGISAVKAALRTTERAIGAPPGDDNGRAAMNQATQRGIPCSP